MPLEAHIIKALRELQDEVAVLQDAYYTFKERCELHADNKEYAIAFAKKKIELLQAAQRLKVFEYKHKIQ